MAEKYSKRALTLEESVEWLRKRGVIIEDREKLQVERFLKSETTFRLMGYVKTNKSVISFADLKHIYFFDRQLRNVFLEAFEIAEVQLRNTAVSLLFSEGEREAFIYEDSSIFDPRFHSQHSAWLEDMRVKVQKRSQEGFVSYYRQHYSDEFPRLPVWALIELMTFSELVNFCGNMSRLKRGELAHNFCIEGRVLFNWFDNFIDVRNACAHHRILFNRPLNRRHLPLTSSWGEVSDTKVGVVLLSLTRFLTIGCGIKDRNKDFLIHWTKRINKLFGKYRTIQTLMNGYGLPSDFSVE